VRILNWNIGHGGGSRIPAICRHIAELSPDLVVLTEFRERNESALRASLEALNYPFIVTSGPTGTENGLLVAARRRIEPDPEVERPEIDAERWLPMRVPDLDLELLALHIPGAPDNKFVDGYGISGTKRKELLWTRTIEYAKARTGRNAVLVGDFNTGVRIDAEGAMFKQSHFMTELLETGFIDTWRHLHPGKRDYTWYSKRRDKATGRTEDHNGFRLDYTFIAPALRAAITAADILHGPRHAGASDHAVVLVELARDPRSSAAPARRTPHAGPGHCSDVEDRVARLGRGRSAGHARPRLRQPGPVRPAARYASRHGLWGER